MLDHISWLTYEFTNEIHSALLKNFIKNICELNQVGKTVRKKLHLVLLIFVMDFWNDLENGLLEDQLYYCC